MSLLSTLNTLITAENIPVETGVFESSAPDVYAVLTPIVDTYDIYADNKPNANIEEVRISLFVKGNYLTLKRNLEEKILLADLTITDRRYISHDDETGYHQIAIDVADYYAI